MIEHHSAIQALSGVPEVPADILLFIPVLRAPLTQDDPVCLHVVHQINGDLGFCHVKTDQICPCCTCHTCTAHQSVQQMLFPDNDQAKEVSLCQTCAALSKQARWNLHRFVTTINKTDRGCSLFDCGDAAVWGVYPQGDTCPNMLLCDCCRQEAIRRATSYITPDGWDWEDDEVDV